MPPGLFACSRVTDFSAAEAWYSAVLGAEPAFHAHETEAVWELSEHAFVAVNEDADRAGGAHHTIFVQDLDERVAAIAARGIEPAERETYSNGVRKVIYRDADGNEVGFGGPPAETADATSASS